MNAGKIPRTGSRHWPWICRTAGCRRFRASRSVRDRFRQSARGASPNCHKGTTAQARLPVRISSPRRLRFTNDPQDLRSADFHIVTVPTPIDASKQPDLEPLRARLDHASARRSRRATSSSTNRPSIPASPRTSAFPSWRRRPGLKWKADFNVGYSPERINPGDKERRFDNILKIVSADTPETLDIVDAVYKSVVTAGTHRAPSIRVAEFAKVLENTQRDINIALINEVALISDRLGIDTQRRARGGRHQVELPALQARPGRRPLHRRRPVLHRPQGRGGRLPPARHPFGAARQRQHGRLCRQPRGPLDHAAVPATAAAWSRCWASPSRRTCPTSAIRAWSTSCASWRISASPSSCTTRGRRRSPAAGIRAGLTPLEKLQPADAVVLAVAHTSYREGGWDLVKPLLRAGAFVADVPALLDRQSTPKGVTLWRL